jgi:hypothetical protein
MGGLAILGCKIAKWSEVVVGTKSLGWGLSAAVQLAMLHAVIVKSQHHGRL